MPQKPVRVEITASFFVNADQASNPEWRQQLQEMHQALGATAAEGTEINFGATFNGLPESYYDPIVKEHAVDNRYSAELATIGEGLNADMGSLLSQAGGLSERATTQLAGKLRNNGLNDVRTMLTAGYGVLRRHDVAGHYGKQSRDAIKRALSSIGVNNIPNAPSANDIALFCDNLDQVSGCALIRPGDEAETFGQQQNKHSRFDLELSGLSGLEYYDDSSRLADYRVWGVAGLLKHRVSELNAMAVDEIAASITKNYDGASQATVARATYVLRDVVQEFTADFTAARERAQ
ncbi:MAG TPA: hypothetical protein VLG16_01785 [Candidatus Saccharimonadales bacterium]|nr:hypothetical protein [Candidatus Saccharimonadales bacterium]